MTAAIDISFLLWLQEIRYALGPGVEAALCAITDFAASVYTVLIPIVIFWCFDKKTGRETLAIFAVAQMLNQFIKNTFCIYRPWIRDARVQVAPEAAEGATGYSFPSGHTVMATTIYGNLGRRYRTSHPGWAAVAFFAVPLVMFTRLYLGCHAPQDVLVGCAEAVLLICLSGPWERWLKEHEEYDTAILIGAYVITAIVCIYWVVKPYPMDYAADGTLLVDPVLMQEDCFQAAGYLLAFVTGWYIDRRYIRFTTEGLTGKVRIARILSGLVITLAGGLTARTLAGGLDLRAREFIFYYVLVIFVTAAAPRMFRFTDRLALAGEKNPGKENRGK